VKKKKKLKSRAKSGPLKKKIKNIFWKKTTKQNTKSQGRGNQ
jgi:hypothetical protein